MRRSILNNKVEVDSGGVENIFGLVDSPSNQNRYFDIGRVSSSATTDEETHQEHAQHPPYVPHTR